MRWRNDILRSRWLLGVPGLLLILVIALLTLRPLASPIGEDNLNKIRPGMPRTAVEELLGGPAGDYRHRKTIYDACEVVVPDGEPMAAEYSFDGVEEWQSDRMLIAVTFDETDRVQSAFGVRPAATSWYRAMRRWMPFLP